MRLFSVLSILLLTASVIAAQTPAAAPAAGAAQAVPAGNAGNGKKIYSTYGCYQCHGYEAHGGQAGPRLAPRPIAFATFTRYVRKPTGQMPPYTGKVVSDQELADIYAFLQTIPAPPAANTIPILAR